MKVSKEVVKPIETNVPNEVVKHENASGEFAKGGRAGSTNHVHHMIEMGQRNENT
jgi:hypothetical protein